MQRKKEKKKERMKERKNERKKGFKEKFTGKSFKWVPCPTIFKIKVPGVITSELML